MNLRELVLDIQVAENLNESTICYNVIRSNVPKNGIIRLPFFGTCKVFRVHTHNSEFKITVSIPLGQAKNAIQGIVQHLTKLDQEPTRMIDENTKKF